MLGIVGEVGSWVAAAGRGRMCCNMLQAQQSSAGSHFPPVKASQAEASVAGGCMND